MTPTLKTPSFRSALAVLAAATLVVWGPLLWAPFTYDDGMYLLNKPEITGAWPGVARWLATPMGGTGVYEPLNLLVHRWLWAAAGDHPAPYRAASLFLHCAAAALVFFLLRRLLRDGPLALGLAALFVVFPPHVDVLAVSTFKKHLLVSVFGLVSLTFVEPRAARRWAGPAAAALLLSALAAKESALAIPLLCLVLAAAKGPGLLGRLEKEKQFWLWQAGACAVFLFWRLRFLPVARRPPLGGGWTAHFLTSGKIFLWYWRQAVFPWPLCAESDLSAIPGVFNLQTLGVLAGLGFAAAAVVWVWKRDRLAGAGLAWAAVALSPFLNLVPSLNLSLVANRYLYLASVGLLLALGRAVAAFRFRGPALAALGLVWGAVSIRQAALYASPFDLWRCTAACAPGNPRAHTEYANELTERGRLADAAAELETAVRLSPPEFLPTSAMLLADAYAGLGRLPEALALAGRQAAANPTTLTLSELGVLKLRAGDPAGAEAPLKKAIELDPLNGDALIALGQVRAGQRRAAAAEELWLSAAAVYPFGPRALAKLGNLYQDQGRLKRAEKAYRLALSEDPFELEARGGLARLYARDGKKAEGLRLFDELLARVDVQLSVLPGGADEEEARAMLRRTRGEIDRARSAFEAKNP